jgi:hypothetical protein
VNTVFYWCGCSKGFPGNVPPPFCALHNDGVERIQMEEVKKEKPKPKTKASKR